MRTRTAEREALYEEIDRLSDDAIRTLADYVAFLRDRDLSETGDGGEAASCDEAALAKAPAGKATQKLFDRLKPVLKEAATAAGEAGKEKARAYASVAANASMEIVAETDALSGVERKSEMKKLILERLSAPAPLRFGLSPLVDRVVGIVVDFEDVRTCLIDPASSPERRKETSEIILKRLNAPFHMRAIAKPLVGCAVNVATEYSHLLRFDSVSGIFSKNGDTAGPSPETDGGIPHDDA